MYFFRTETYDRYPETLDCISSISICNFFFFGSTIHLSFKTEYNPEAMWVSPTFSTYISTGKPNISISCSSFQTVFFDKT